MTDDRLGIIKQSPRQAGVDDVEWLCEEVERLLAIVNLCPVCCGTCAEVTHKPLSELREEMRGVARGDRKASPLRKFAADELSAMHDELKASDEPPLPDAG